MPKLVQILFYKVKIGKNFNIWLFRSNLFTFSLKNFAFSLKTLVLQVTSNWIDDFQLDVNSICFFLLLFDLIRPSTGLVICNFHSTTWQNLKEKKK